MMDYVKTFLVVLIVLSLIVVGCLALVAGLFVAAYHLSDITGLHPLLFFGAEIVVGLSIAMTISIVREERQK